MLPSKQRDFHQYEHQVPRVLAGHWISTAPPQSQSQLAPSWPSPLAQGLGSLQPQAQPVSGSVPAPQVPYQPAEKIDLHLKILDPSCKKEGDLHILRGHGVTRPAETRDGYTVW